LKERQMIMKYTGIADKLGIFAMAFCLAAPMGLTALPASAEDKSVEMPFEISANVALTSDYRFRGLTQTKEHPATQGGLDLSAGPVYLGVWGSGVDFGDSDAASVEIDVYGGVTYEFKGIGVDLGLIYYTYPGAASSLNYDYVEGKIALSYSPFESVSLGVGYNYSPDYFGASGEYHYPNASVEVSVPDLPVTLSGTYGYSDIDNATAFGAPSYSDWSVGLAMTYKQVELKVQYIDNDLSGDSGDPAVVFTASASF
jgi:uncharacterized protein (TIGR02001 family)